MRDAAWQALECRLSGDHLIGCYVCIGHPADRQPKILNVSCVSSGVSGRGARHFLTPPAPRDTQESYTTVRFRVAQFDSGQKVYQASGDVPISADGGIEKMSPVASVGN